MGQDSYKMALHNFRVKTAMDFSLYTSCKQNNSNETSIIAYIHFLKNRKSNSNYNIKLEINHFQINGIYFFLKGNSDLSP